MLASQIQLLNVLVNANQPPDAVAGYLESHARCLPEAAVREGLEL